MNTNLREGGMEGGCHALGVVAMLWGGGASRSGGFIQEQGEMQGERGGVFGGGVSRSGEREKNYTMQEQGERRHIKRARHAETGTGIPPTQEGTAVSKDGGGRGGVLGAYSSSKEAYSSSKEACSSSNEAYCSTKEPYGSSKETCRTSKDAYNSSAETSSKSKETNSSRAAENSNRLFEATYAAYASLSQFHSTSPGPT